MGGNRPVESAIRGDQSRAQAGEDWCAEHGVDHAWTRELCTGRRRHAACGMHLRIQRPSSCGKRLQGAGSRHSDSLHKESGGRGWCRRYCEYEGGSMMTPLQLYIEKRKEKKKKSEGRRHKLSFRFENHALCTNEHQAMCQEMTVRSIPL